jgi:hypothetical protein
MFQTVGGIGRAMFLPVTSIIQTNVQGKGAGVSGGKDMEAFLRGLRAVEWFCVGCMAFSVIVTVWGLRNMGKIGLLKKLGAVQSASPKGEEEV